MKNRLSFRKTDLEAIKTLGAFEVYLAASQISPLQKELIKIRASQINGCSYCIDMHTRDARKLGETEQRIYALNAWRETPFFNEEERAMLALTEQVTVIQRHVSDEVYDHAVAVLGEKLVAQVIMAVIAVNAWNRIGISTNMMPALSQA